MKEKNVKGITGLCFGLIAIVFAALSMIPMIQLTGMGLNGEISFFGQINIVFSLCTLVSAVIAVIFGAMSKKDADKPGPRKSGVVIGIIFILIGLISFGVTSSFAAITEYINSDGRTGVIADTVKDDPEQQKQMDEWSAIFSVHSTRHIAGGVVQFLYLSGVWYSVESGSDSAGGISVMFRRNGSFDRPGQSAYRYVFHWDGTFYLMAV